MMMCLHNHFAPPNNTIPKQIIKPVQQVGYYQCPEDNRQFPDAETLLIHWQIEHPYLAEVVAGLESQERQDWLNRFKK